MINSFDEDQLKILNSYKTHLKEIKNNFSLYYAEGEADQLIIKRNLLINYRIIND